MNKKISVLIASVFPVFLVFYFLNKFLLNVFNIINTNFANKFFLFIVLLSMLMITNLLLVQIIKPKITGFVFLAWSMLKIMLVLAYFAFFIIPKNIKLSNSFVYYVIIIYCLFLIYETIFSFFLIDRK